MGGPPSPGSTNSSPEARAKESDKQQGTYFLGRYRVVDEIGVGGMASVHLARMDGPGGFQKWVAIKRIHPHLVEDDQFVDMFLDEARIAAGINHANVAQVFDLGKDDNTYWIAMEYLHGEPLREVMRRAEERRLRISPELAARICSDAAEGLHAAHELRGKNGQLLGLVHRDVTPHNLFLTYDGYTKVVDFGIAKVADRLSSTRAGTLKGKLAYMSPEQVRGNEVDRTTDVFALGVVLWELTTNQRLFRMDTDLDTLEKVQACVVPPPSTIVSDYPIELESVVMKALAKHKHDRFQTAREFSRALQNFLMRSGVFVGSEEVAQFVQQVFVDRIQKREAHLAWAAEVTSTINVEQVRARNSTTATDSVGLRSRGREPEPQRLTPPQVSRQNAAPASGIAPVGRTPSREHDDRQMVASSLMDDDEDVPTTVAMREQAEPVRSLPHGERPMVRPAAGMMLELAPASPPQAGAQSRIPTVRPGMPTARPGVPTVRPGFSPGYPSPPRAPGGHDPAPPPLSPSPYPPRDFETGELAPPPMGGLLDRELNSPLASTLALPSQDLPPILQGASEPARHARATRTPAVATPAQGHAAVPYALPFNGQVHSPAPAAQVSTVAPATASMTVGQAQLFASASAAQPPQSQIETALSLPRPDPAAIWAATQDAASKGNGRNTLVLVAVITLTVLCVLGIGALIYMKTSAVQSSPSRSGDAAPATPASAEPTSSGQSSSCEQQGRSAGLRGACALALRDGAAVVDPGRIGPRRLTITG
ncbi:protein kinase domain-containing protein [Sorangium sp. So ce1000]|uniref:serine/threonine-protein kinase n=1 Tax=Sorangium sp. So ce1000 TaxID=3133325 RepID=UPI003F6072B0